MLLRSIVLAVFTGIALPVALPALSQSAQAVPEEATRIVAFAETMQIGPVLEVMHAEGIDYGSALREDMFPDQDGASWEAVVRLIYDTDTMRKRFDTAFVAALTGDPAALAEMEAFFGSDLGRRITTLEIEARRVLLDDAAEEAAKVALAEMAADEDPRLTALKDFAEANDLIESNVMGALNANLAFYRAMAEAGGFGEDVPEDQMLTDVWSQEDSVREETTDWLFPYLALAYKPLSDADLAAYQVFSESAAGQRLNAALFQAFDAIFVNVSRDLGLAAARQLQGEEL